MLIDDSVGLKGRKAISFDHGADRLGASPPAVSAGGAFARRALVFGALAILFAAMAYIAAVYGFHAVVRCEIETNSALAQHRGAMSEIAMSDACGF